MIVLCIDLTRLGIKIGRGQIKFVTSNLKAVGCNYGDLRAIDPYSGKQVIQRMAFEKWVR